jgi:hypothetical protein
VNRWRDLIVANLASLLLLLVVLLLGWRQEAAFGLAVLLFLDLLALLRSRRQAPPQAGTDGEADSAATGEGGNDE